MTSPRRHTDRSAGFIDSAQPANEAARADASLAARAFASSFPRRAISFLYRASRSHLGLIWARTGFRPGNAGWKTRRARVVCCVFPAPALFTSLVCVHLVRRLLSERSVAGLLLHSPSVFRLLAYSSARARAHTHIVRSQGRYDAARRRRRCVFARDLSGLAAFALPESTVRFALGRGGCADGVQ